MTKDKFARLVRIFGMIVGIVPGMILMLVGAVVGVCVTFLLAGFEVGREG